MIDNLEGIEIRVYSLYQGITYHGTYSSLVKVLNALEINASYNLKTYNLADGVILYSFQADGKKWHVYETSLDQHVILQ